MRHNSAWVSEVLLDIAVFLRTQGMLRAAEEAQDVIATVECEAAAQKRLQNDTQDNASAQEDNAKR